MTRDYLQSVSVRELADLIRIASEELATRYEHCRSTLNDATADLDAVDQEIRTMQDIARETAEDVRPATIGRFPDPLNPGDVSRVQALRILLAEPESNVPTRARVIRALFGRFAVDQDVDQGAERTS